jgi:hypothetical protein
LFRKVSPLLYPPLAAEMKLSLLQVSSRYNAFFSLCTLTASQRTVGLFGNNKRGKGGYFKIRFLLDNNLFYLIEKKLLKY